MQHSRSFKAIVLSIGKASAAVAGVVQLAILSRLFDKHEYATFRQTLLAFHFAAPLLTLGLPQALFYFLPATAEKKRQVLAKNLFLLVLMATVFTGFLLLGGNRLLAWRFHNPDLVKTLRIIAPYALCMLPAAGLSACLLVQNRVVQLAVFNVASKIALVVLIATAAFLFRTTTAVLAALVATSAVLLLPALAMMFHACPGSLEWPRWATLKAMLAYSAPLGLATMVSTISLQLDKVIVSSMCSPEQFAVYANGAMEIPVIGIITASISAVLLADMAPMCRAGKHAEALGLFHTAAVKSSSIILPMACFLLATAGPVVEVLYSSKYAASALPFRFYLLLLPARVIFYGPVLMAVGKTRLILVRSLVGLFVNAVLSILLVKLMGYIGAVIATLLTVYLWSIVFNIAVISRSFSVSLGAVLPLKKLGTVLLVSLALVPLAVAGSLLGQGNRILSVALATVLYWPAVLFVLGRMGHGPIPILRLLWAKR